MQPPYEPGDKIAWIDAEEDGMHVTRVEVLSLNREGPGWSVETERGTESVDQWGVGARTP